MVLNEDSTENYSFWKEENEVVWRNGRTEALMTFYLHHYDIIIDCQGEGQ